MAAFRKWARRTWWRMQELAELAFWGLIIAALGIGLLTWFSAMFVVMLVAAIIIAVVNAVLR